MSWKGKKVAVTGKFIGKRRSDVEAIITAAGAIVVNTVNKKTDLLVVGTGTDSGSKQANATKFGVPTVDLTNLSSLASNNSWPFPERPNSPTKKQIDMKLKEKAQVAKKIDAAFDQVASSSGLSNFVGF